MSTRRKILSVVLAGGFGTRLSPLTDSKPKPLVKILDKTVLENVVSAVKKTETERIVVSTFYKSDMIEALCKEWDGNISCKKETVPLGTAGGAKNCCDGKYDAVLIVSGDAVFDFSLQRAVDFHFEQKNDVTIVTSRNENPTRFGTVICDDENNVVRFDEKPSWKKVATDLVNTGIYVLSPYAVESIPDRIEYDFSKNLFPKLMKEGRRVKSLCEDAFWCDIGTLDEYYNCNVFASENKISSIKNDGLSKRQLLHSGVHADENVYVSQNAFVGKNVRLGKGSILCENVIAGDDCDISAAIIGKGTNIGKGSTVNSAIIGENVSVGENCIVPEGVVIGDGCRIADGTVIEKNTVLNAGKALFGKEMSIMSFSRNEYVFVDDGVAAFNKENMFANLAYFVKAVSCAFRKSDSRHMSICIMSDEQHESVKNLIFAGMLDEGDVVFDGGKGNKAMLSFGVKKLETDAGIFVSGSEKNIYLFVVSQNGRVIDDSEERKISKIYSSVSYDSKSASDCVPKGKILAVPVCEMYQNSLLKYAEKLLSQTDFSGVEISVSMNETLENPSSGALAAVLKSKECKLSGVSDKSVLNVSISEDGMTVKMRKENLLLDGCHVCAAILQNAGLFADGDTAVSENVPAVLKNIIKTPSDNKPEFFIDLDGGACAIAFLAVMKLCGKTPNELFGEIPEFEIFADEYIADVNRASTMERLSKLYNNSKRDDGDGIHLSLPDGTVTVIPNRVKGFKIVAEAANMEAAKELCFKVGKAIKNE